MCLYRVFVYVCCTEPCVFVQSRVCVFVQSRVCVCTEPCMCFVQSHVCVCTEPCMCLYRAVWSVSAQIMKKQSDLSGGKTPKEKTSFSFQSLMSRMAMYVSSLGKENTKVSHVYVCPSVCVVMSHVCGVCMFVQSRVVCARTVVCGHIEPCMSVCVCTGGECVNRAMYASDWQIRNIAVCRFHNHTEPCMCALPTSRVCVFVQSLCMCVCTMYVCLYRAVYVC